MRDKKVSLMNFYLIDSLKVGGVSNQIQFSRPHLYTNSLIEASRVQEKIVDITNEWTTKRVSPIRYKDTHTYLFSQDPLKTQT